ncbi:PIR Superfamily Protein [Plasmodium ovale wallikeri]|uniref:PIR Superfamily Protein n=1 Tax=Plasmodium ovale wallikeri TaxID=864142 RepID=A0A1A9AQ08_PLAOA|nr:PIR Superfamily Protein [Plasmodium ovale wallikeri]SBT58186.1 PIR Superfamily Protein [Plasmodium ovale wallikeri]
MVSLDTNKCELPSEKLYNELERVEISETSENICNLEGNLLDNYPELKVFCRKFASNLELFKKKEEEKEKSTDIQKYCAHIKHWMQNKVITTVPGNSSIIYIGILYKVWNEINETFKDPNINKCDIKVYYTSTDHFQKWKKMYDYNDNYKELKCIFHKKEDCMEDCIETCEECTECCNEDCKEKYCLYFLDITNIYKEFKYVCDEATNQKCPDFWEHFKENYSKVSYIESQCKEIYEDLGYYKVKMSFGDNGDEKYVEQYESTYIFSFFEKLIGYSIKKILSKTLHYSRYIVLPILLILLFYFFMKKLSFFGSKIAPKTDDMRKMWRNVQGVANPASLLNPMKPPGGGNKMGLPYLPK